MTASRRHASCPSSVNKSPSFALPIAAAGCWEPAADKVSMDHGPSSPNASSAESERVLSILSSGQIRAPQKSICSMQPFYHTSSDPVEPLDQGCSNGPCHDSPLTFTHTHTHPMAMVRLMFQEHARLPLERVLPEEHPLFFQRLLLVLEVQGASPLSGETSMEVVVVLPASRFLCPLFHHNRQRTCKCSQTTSSRTG